MNLRIFVLVGLCFCVSCCVMLDSTLGNDMQEGEALYGMNLKRASMQDHDGVAESIFSQELLLWKRKFIKDHGVRKWQLFRAKVIKKYGREERLDWFLGQS
jgi:hypothetical protein